MRSRRFAEACDWSCPAVCRMFMLPAQIVFLAASHAVLGMASDGLWAAATIHPGIAILAAIQACARLDAAAGLHIMRLHVSPSVQMVDSDLL